MDRRNRSHPTRRSRPRIWRLSAGCEINSRWAARLKLRSSATATNARPATTALLGRKNYQGFGAFWPAVAYDENADPRDRAFAGWLNEVEKVVVSRTLTEAGWQNSRIAADDPAEIVRQLRKQEGGDIIVLASGRVIRSLLEAGELDRLSITLCPELVGAGGRFFGDGPAGSSWSLTEATPTSSGALCLLYDLIRPAAGH